MAAAPLRAQHALNDCRVIVHWRATQRLVQILIGKQPSPLQLGLEVVVVSLFEYIADVDFGLDVDSAVSHHDTRMGINTASSGPPASITAGLPGSFRRMTTVPSLKVPRTSRRYAALKPISKGSAS